GRDGGRPPRGLAGEAPAARRLDDHPAARQEPLALGPAEPAPQGEGGDPHQAARARPPEAAHPRDLPERRRAGAGDLRRRVRRPPLFRQERRGPLPPRGRRPRRRPPLPRAVAPREPQPQLSLARPPDRAADEPQPVAAERVLGRKKPGGDKPPGFVLPNDRWDRRR